jgi:predicted RNase H-like nuclease (RuvC/YqgF family)
LDSAIISNRFKEIEKKVERLTEICRHHEAANLELKKNIKDLEEELLGKIEAEKSYAHEKALIRSRIERLLLRIEESMEV